MGCAAQIWPEQAGESLGKRDLLGARRVRLRLAYRSDPGEVATSSLRG